MTNRKTTRRALVLSLLSLLLCCSMLVGTTFAWFTDSVTSGNNRIVAGNLDVEVYYGDPTAKNSIEKVNTLFNKVTLWEPGVVAYENLTVVNEGTLALKYQMAVNFTNENTVDGYGLSQILKVGVVTGGIAENSTREQAVAAVTQWQPMKSFTWSGELAAKTADKTVGLVIYWEPSSDDNNWNVNNGKKVSDFETTQLNELHIDLGIELFATQLTSEKDSFGPDYDAGAAWTGSVNTDWYFADPDAETFTIKTAEELAGFAALVNGTATAPVTTFAADAAATVHDDFAGQTVKLGANIDLRDVAWTPIGRIGVTSTDFTYSFRGTFDGGNYTVSNLNVSGYGWTGLFGIAYKAEINNVKLSGVTIKSNRMAGSVVGQLYGSINNCHVANANIIVVPNAVEGGYDNGDKVGGIVGWIGDNGNNRTLTGCSVTDAQIGAYRDVGGIAGYAATTTTISGNTVTGETDITVDQTSNYYGDKEPNAGAIWGRGTNLTTENNTIGEMVTVSSTYIKDGLTLKQNGITGKTTLYLVPAAYENTTVNVPEGVTNIGGYAFAYNSNVETINLSSTVTTLNDRAFRDTSASTVVLNEGLTNISYQAFRNAANVTEVVIPSTVTTISTEAFQNSGVKTLTVPANVTTIEYGAMRDMKELETVVLEGNADIPVYAFRACAKLRTVFINGEDVTFGGGSRGMIFTNKENGDGSAITVLVKNETVKERLLAADTAAKDYGGYTIVVGATPVSNAQELTEALGNSEVQYILLTENVKTEAATTAPYGNKYGFKQDGGVIDGNGNELYMECYGDDYGIMTSGGTVKNVTIKEGCRAVMIMYATEDVILNNVNIGGDGVLYPINTGEYATASGVDLIVTDSVLAGWVSFAGIESASFTNVQFEQGTYYNNIYGRVLKPYVNTTLTNCSFVEHMNLDLSGLTQGQKIVIKNCTVNGKPVTADVFTVPTADAQYDTELFTLDLPSWATSIADCVVFQ